jgi:hypothetical protein
MFLMFPARAFVFLLDHSHDVSKQFVSVLGCFCAVVGGGNGGSSATVLLMNLLGVFGLAEPAQSSAPEAQLDVDWEHNKAQVNFRRAAGGPRSNQEGAPETKAELHLLPLSPSTGRGDH